MLHQLNKKHNNENKIFRNNSRVIATRTKKVIVKECFSCQNYLVLRNQMLLSNKNSYNRN